MKRARIMQDLKDVMSNMEQEILDIEKKLVLSKKEKEVAIDEKKAAISLHKTLINKYTSAKLDKIRAMVDHAIEYNASLMRMIEEAEDVTDDVETVLWRIVERKDRESFGACGKAALKLQNLRGKIKLLR